MHFYVVTVKCCRSHAGELPICDACGNMGWVLKFDNMHLTWIFFPCSDVKVVRVHGEEKTVPGASPEKSSRIRYKFRPHRSQTPFFTKSLFSGCLLG